MKQSLENLDDFPFEYRLLFPKDNKDQISKNKHVAYVVLQIKESKPLDDDDLLLLQSLIKTPSHMSVQIGGRACFYPKNKSTNPA